MDRNRAGGVVDMKANHEAPWMCVQCGYLMDATSCFDDPSAVPSAGDLSKCMNCGREYMRRDDRWQPMTAAERAALAPEERRELERIEWARQRAALPDLSKRGGRA